MSLEKDLEQFVKAFVLDTVACLWDGIAIKPIHAHQEWINQEYHASYVSSYLW